MRSRFIAFILFQVISWTLYFNWEVSTEQKSFASLKMVRIEDISPRTVRFPSRNENLYRLILRNDGFYTRINADQTRENGLWKVDYDIPSIILASPAGELHYRIIDHTEDWMQVKQITAKEIVKNELNTTEPERLFSASSLN